MAAVAVAEVAAITAAAAATARVATAVADTEEAGTEVVAVAGVAAEEEAVVVRASGLDGPCCGGGRPIWRVPSLASIRRRRLAA